jgi:VIT1/CCC1 family predicted Fe2+/Mn2+ transporter
MKETVRKYLPSIVYGGSDGAVSYFTLMAGAYGAGLSLKMLLAIGISNIVADAFSMASADYLAEDSRKGSTSSEKEISSFVTFIAFILVGSFPLIPSIYAYSVSGPDATLPLSMFLLSTVLTILGFSYIGYLRGKILRRNLLRTILQSIIICSLSAAVAYYLGEVVVKMV